MHQPDFRSAKDSQTTLAELMIPMYANFGGKIHGGVILSLLDKVAYTCASAHSRGYCVTVSVDGVEFLNPIEVGELLKLHASVNYTGNSSMVIGIKVVSENFKAGTVKHTNTSYFTMVALDEETKKPRKIPGLLLESADSIRRYLEAMHRKELKDSYKSKLKEEEAELNIEKEIILLQNHNCQIPSSSSLMRDE